MNRFLPDTWWEILLRPFAMAAPDGNTYVEIMAPDWRFVFGIALAAALALGLLVLRRRSAASTRATLVLLLLVAVSFVPWMASTGNGRYFVPILLLVGPLCVALAYLQPWSRGARALCAVGMVLLQTFAAVDTRPWDAWSLASWREAPYFDLAVPPELREHPATYVTLTSISYSLLYPQFHPASHWVNISAMSDDPEHSLDTRRARDLFARSHEIYLLVPTTPDQATKDGQPNKQLQDVMNHHLGFQRLALDRTRSCRMLESHTVARIVFGENASKHKPETLAALGFWLCPLKFPVAPPPPPVLDPRVEAAFDRVEQACPGLFPPGTASTSQVEGASLRNYAGADMKVYIANGGDVYYKYWRALNAEKIATVAQVLAPSFHLDCHNIHGRSGLPWERSL